jgi:hypothetical protein
MPTPAVLIVTPPPIRVPKGPIAPKFLGAEQKCLGLPAAYERIATEERCHYFDAGQVTASSVVDGVHLDADQHTVLGQALAEVVSSLLRSRPT